MKIKDNWMSIKIDTPLKERIETVARKERRSIADQAAYLMEKGLALLEKEALGAGKKARQSA